MKSRISLIVLLGTGAFFGTLLLQSDTSAVCGQGVGCLIDIDCEFFGGSTCLNAGGLQTCCPFGPPDWEPWGSTQCGLKLYGAAGYCAIPGGGCGGPQCMTC